MTVLSDFSALITAEINKGTTLDTYIANRIKMAGRRIEKNNSLKYMEALTTLSLPVDTAYINIPARFKSLNWMRFTDDDGAYQFLTQVDGEQITSIETDTPSGFWQLGGTPTATANSSQRWYFDCEPEEAISIDAMINYYSDWDTATSFWLMVHAQELMIAEVMMLMAPIAREPGWLTLYKPMKEEGERTLFLADQEIRRSSRDEVMIYANRGSDA